MPDSIALPVLLAIFVLALILWGRSGRSERPFRD